MGPRLSYWHCARPSLIWAQINNVKEKFMIKITPVFITIIMMMTLIIILMISLFIIVRKYFKIVVVKILGFLHIVPL